MEAAQRQQQLQPGHLLLQRYRIGSLLAFGGMGEIYNARDEELDRPVAVKVLPRIQNDINTEVERFQRQAPAAARIRHPGVVETYDRGTEGGIHFVVMEKLEGQDLSHRIREQPRLDPGFIVRVGIELARAAHAAHRKGVIHRDLKPSNVFLAVSGDQVDVVKVLDFGVAKIVDAKVMTQTGQVIGTLTYMAPEQLESAKHVDTRADIYSIGCILYEMLTARPPYTFESAVELVMKIRNDSPDPIGRFRDDVPDELVAVVEQAMHRNPMQRFSNAELLANALNKIAIGLDISVPPTYGSLPPRRSSAPQDAGQSLLQPSSGVKLEIPPTVLSAPPSAATSGQTTIHSAASNPPKSLAQAEPQVAPTVLSEWLPAIERPQAAPLSTTPPTGVQQRSEKRWIPILLAIAAVLAVAAAIALTGSF